MKNSLVLRVILFYTIAIIVSNLFRFDVFNLNVQIAGWPTWISILVFVFLEGAGVFIGAVVAITWMRKVKKPSLSFFGTSKQKSLILLITPLIVLSAVGIENSFGLNAHVYGLIAGIGTFIYCILEEYGWRGYLQDDLSGLKSWMRYTLIGFMWYLWHLSFLTTTSIQDNLIFLVMLIIGSWGIGQVAIATKSIVACAAFHFLVNIFMFNQLISNGLIGNSRLIAVGSILVVSVVVISLWNKANKNATDKVGISGSSTD